jgi:transcriptional regulator with XRE-family HTH domain
LLSKLKETRAKANLSQYKIAKMLKIPRTTYASYEIGRNRLPFNLIVELKKILNTSDDNIFLADTQNVKNTS